MLLFRDEQAIETWCQQTGEPYGAVVPLEKFWQLSKVWYGNRMSPEYRGRTKETVVAIFQQFGLTDDFWKFT